MKLEGERDIRLLTISGALWLGSALTCWGIHGLFILFVVALAFLISYRTLSILLIAVLIVGAGGVAIRELALTTNALHRLARANQYVEVEGTVTSDPSQGSARVIGSQLRPGSFSFKARTSLLVGKANSYSIRAPIRVSSRIDLKLKLGETFHCQGKVFLTTDHRVSALLSVNRPCSRLRSASLLNRITGDIRSSFSRSALTFAGDGGALMPGLVLGDTSQENNDFKLLMRKAGLTHLTAVSGANFAIISSSLLWITQWFFRRKGLRLVVTCLVLIGFIFLVRPSPSVLRACVMTGVLLVSNFRGQRASPLASLAFAVSLLILLDPFQAVDPGFALSVAATMGILIFSPRLEERLSRYFGPLSNAIAIPLAATLFCLPIIIAISGQFSLVTLPANVAVAAVVAPITVIGLIAALLSPLLPGVTHLLLLLIYPCSAWIAYVARISNHLPALLFPRSSYGVFIVLMVIVAVLFHRLKWILLITTALVLALALPISLWPGSDWSFASCDVGQGDGSVINLGAHRGIVIDAGPDPLLMERCLDRLGIRKVPLLVLTHFHADHVMGISGVLAHRSVEHVWVSNLAQPTLDYEMTIKALGSIPREVVTQGTRYEVSGAKRVRILVLWPRGAEENFAPLPGDGSAINNSSIALCISVGSLSIFASGDIEPPAQESIANSGLVQQVKLLKVAHHGSAYQYLPLLDLLKPAVALISVGTGNSYGHPALSTLSALRSRGITYFRTDRDGSVAVSDSLRIRSLKRDWWKISWG